jgi:peptide/nickel transport system substrate-binding protein
MFWYQDIFSDKNLTPSAQPWLISGGKPVTVTKIDDTTVRFSFAKPNSQFLQSLAQVKGGEITAYPKHYLQQFLPKYNPNVNTLVQAAGVKDYAALLVSKFGVIGTPDDQSRWQHPELPTLNAWVLTNTYGTDNPIVATRNPYYWKIDTAGHQLPYIDKFEVTISDSSDDILQMALAGKLDMQDRWVGNSLLTVTQAQTQLVNGQQSGGYHLFKTVFSSMNSMMLAFNLTDKDPALRSVFQDKNFRIGMSYAINRPKIIADTYGGHGEPWQGAPRKESPFYDATFAKQYTEYDVAKANAYLDKTSLVKDAEGRRLLPNGQQLTLTVDWGDLKGLQQIQSDWAAVGVKMIIGNLSDRTAYYNKKNSNNADLTVWSGDGGFDVVQDPRWYFPFSTESNFAPAWAAAYYAPSSPIAETPPADVKKQQDLYNQLIEAPDAAQQTKLMKQILKISKDQFYAIGISLPTDGFGIVKNNFHNVPATMPSAWTYPNPAPTNPCQYYIN